MNSRRLRFRERAGRRALWVGVALCVPVVLAWSSYHGYFNELYGQGRRAAAKAAGGVGAVAGSVQATAGKALGHLLTHPYFAVREVKVLGAEKLKGADIVVMSGLGPDTRIWSIDPTELEERVRQHPWVKRALVRRELPARLVISIEEWKPGGIVALDRLYYVADNGVIFKALDEGDSVDFPFITGLRAAELGPRDPETREKLAEVLSFGRTVEKTTLGLSEIRFQPGGGVVLYPVSYQVPFHVGWGDWDAKLDRLQWFVREFPGQGARFKAVDVSFKGQVVARPRGRV